MARTVKVELSIPQARLLWDAAGRGQDEWENDLDYGFNHTQRDINTVIRAMRALSQAIDRAKNG